MYKVLIVDDESFVIKSLIATINWSEHGFKVVGQAKNGIEALEAIVALKPDLVFTDVKMPGMGGLELIKNANQSGMDVLFVVISGYAEFAYVQKAMNYGVLGYCLKPFEDSEIISVLLKARSKLDESKVSMENKLLELLDDKSGEGLNKIRALLESLGFECGTDSQYLVIVSIGRGKLTLPRHVKCIDLILGNNKNVLLMETDQIVYVKEYLTAHFPENISGIGMCVPCHLEQIKLTIEEGVVTATQFFITGTKGIYESSSLKQEELNLFIRQLETAIDSKESTQIIKALEFMDSSRNSYDIRHALRVYNMVMSFLYRLDTVRYEDYVYSYEHLTSLFEGLQQMIVYLKELLDKQIHVRREPLPKDLRNETFRNILDYVNENYSKNISIQSISQHYKINPNYVSQLFKKGLDVTFTEYVTRLRISLACNLLKTTSLPINEIADRAGYDEYYYFTRVFKKVTGKTPTEFRL